MKQEFIEKQMERLKILNADPEFQARRAERLRIFNADPEFQAKRKLAVVNSERFKEHVKSLHTPAAIKRNTERMLSAEFIAKRKAGVSNSEALKAHARRQQPSTQTEEVDVKRRQTVLDTRMRRLEMLWSERTASRAYMLPDPVRAEIEAILESVK